MRERWANYNREGKNNRPHKSQCDAEAIKRQKSVLPRRAKMRKKRKSPLMS